MILLDGLNLSLREGTGIATYARNLACLLAVSGREVGIVYGQRKRWNIAHYTYSSPAYWFFQSLQLGLDNYLPSSLLARLATAATMPFSNLGDGLKAIHIRPGPAMQYRDLLLRLPAEALPYNSPRLFETAFLRNYVTGSLQKLCCPHGTRIFHSTTLLPVIATNAPNVCTIHDIIPLKIPGSTSVDLDCYYRLLRTVIKRYDRILTVSEASRKDILDACQCEESRIAVMYQSSLLHELYSGISSGVISDYLSAHALEKRRYVLCVGAIEPKKNYPRMIQAYAESALEIPLVIVGKSGWLTEETERALQPFLANDSLDRRLRRKRKHIIRIPYVTARELTLFYRGASLLFFCSLYEGFGLPVLEAMSLGCPVICSNVSSLPEIAGKSAVLVDPYDVREMRNALERVVFDDDYRQSLRDTGFARAEIFSPQRITFDLSQFYASLGA
jgi:glycosyltransferase involved in cell wall biosynthesis